MHTRIVYVDYSLEHVRITQKNWQKTSRNLGSFFLYKSNHHIGLAQVAHESCMIQNFARLLPRILARGGNTGMCTRINMVGGGGRIACESLDRMERENHFSFLCFIFYICFHCLRFHSALVAHMRIYSLFTMIVLLIFVCFLYLSISVYFVVFLAFFLVSLGSVYYLSLFVYCLFLLVYCLFLFA